MGNKIVERRKELKMSQEELSAKSGISRGTIVMLENDSTHNTSYRVLKALASALDTTIDGLFYD